MNIDSLLTEIAEMSTLGMLLQQIMLLEVTRNYPKLNNDIHDTFHLLAEDTIIKIAALKRAIIEEGNVDQVGFLNQHLELEKTKKALNGSRPRL